MLYPTLNQPLMFVLLLVAGFLAGLIFDIFNLISTLLGNDKITTNFFSFLSVLFSFALLFLTNLIFNYGQYRLYVLLIFLAAFLLERLISRFLWTKLVKKCYSKISRRKFVKSGKREKK